MSQHIVKPVSVRQGTLCVVAASLLFSLGGLGIKLIPWQPLSVNGARNLISIVMIAFYMKKTGHKLIVNKGVLTGAFCMCATTTLYVIANKLTTAANAIVLQFTAPVFLIFIMAIFFHERPTRLDRAMLDDADLSYADLTLTDFGRAFKDNAKF